MLSSLSKGYGTWCGDVGSHQPLQETALPCLDSGSHSHRHGITITPRAKSAPKWIPVATDGRMDIPKTFLTRKGALMLFTAPDSLGIEPERPAKTHRKRRHKAEVVDVSLKLKTLERLSLSVLQFGDKLYDRENSSVTDKDNRLFLNFLHDLDQEHDNTDLHSQPGGDFKFYLRDLKRRASGRMHGTGDATPMRARSVELQEILDQLEQAWPKYASSSYRAESFLNGSTSSGDDFYYPSSPTPSVRSSRSRVLSSKKLTASLKSLNYLGRPTSTEPDTASAISDNLKASTDFQFGRSKSARSAVWVTDSSTPVALSTRPVTSHRMGGGRVPAPPPVDRKLVTSPEHSEEEGEDPKKGLWIDVDGQVDQAYLSDDGQSVVSNLDPDRPKSRASSHRGDGLFGEAASILSSLVEEDGDLPLNDGMDGDDQKLDDGSWLDDGVSGRKSVTSSRSKTPKQKLEDDQDVDSEVGLAQPLQPPYSGVLIREDDTRSPVGEEDNQEGSVSASRSVSRAGTQVTSRAASVELGASRPVSALADEALQPGSAPHTPVASRADTPVATPHEEPPRSKSALSSGDPVDKPAPDPDTLVSLQKDDAAVADTLTKDNEKSESPKLDKTTSTVTVPEAELKVSTMKDSPVVKPTVASPKKPDTTEAEKIEEPKVQIPAGPKRRERPQDVKTPRSDEEGNEESSTKKEGDGEVPQLSERVRREKEERELKAAKLKEEKEMAEALKLSEEEKKRTAAENKKKAAEERLKQKAEEVARKKEEEKRMKEEQAALPPEAPEESQPDVKKEASEKTAVTQEMVAENQMIEAGEKQYVKALDITSYQTDDATSQEKTAVGGGPPAPPVAAVVAPEKKEAVPDHLKDMFSRKTDNEFQEELEQGLGKMRSAVDEALGGSVLQTEANDGLSAEDFELAQQALMEKIKKAQEQMEDIATPHAPPPPEKKEEAKDNKGMLKKKGIEKKGPPEKKGVQKKVASPKKKKPEPDEKAKEREALKEQRRLEKERKLAEIKELQNQIAEKEGERKAKEIEAKKKAEELADKMELIRMEEEELERVENDAREQLVLMRKVQREEREARRKADLEKKKQEAINKREKEKNMMEEAKRKEQEMLDRIADAEMSRRLREEAEAKREEEEMIAQEEFEAELKAAQRASEEEEERLRELERQAEEEAFQRILEEKEAAEEKRWELEEQARKMKEEEERARREMLEEEARLEAERKKHEEEEEQRREQERERLRELQRLEEEARDKMRAELDKRRSAALKRREQNLETRANLDSIRQSQGITDPWTYSYFVRWPKESYNRPMGQDPMKKKGPPRPKPKPPAQDAAPAPPAVDVAAVPS